MSKLFRDEVIQRRLSEIGVPSGITHGWMKLFALTLAAMIAAASTGVAFGSYARKARVGGFLVPDKGLIKVVATRGGRIAERRVEEGQHVAKDDVLFVVDVGAVTAAGRTADLVVQSLRDRRKLVDQELQRLGTVQAAEAEHLDAQIAALRMQILGIKAEFKVRADFLRLAKSAFDRTRLLEAKAVSSAAQREKAEQDVVSAQTLVATLDRAMMTAQGDLAQSEAQKHGAPDKQANDRSVLERSRAEIDQQMLQVEEQRFLVVRAPEAGAATQITAAPGSAADPATPLLTIIPDGAKLVASLYVPSGAAGFVKVGGKVLLRYESFPYQKFGTQAAIVTTISRTSVDAKELPYAVKSDEPLYLVTAELEKSTILAFGREEALQPGTKFQADMVLENRKIWEWVIQPLLAAREQVAN